MDFEIVKHKYTAYNGLGNDVPYIITYSSNRDTKKMFGYFLMSMSIAQEHVLGRVVVESQFNSQKIRVVSIKKDDFVKVHN
jgi:hypothetical protein